MSDADDRARDALDQIFKAALGSVRPGPAVTKNLPPKPKGKCVVVGAGKASAAMAQAVEQAWPDVELSGVIATRYGHAKMCERIRIIEAGHPVPDENSEIAARELLAAVEGLEADDMVLALISGGGSANLAAPIDGVSLKDKQNITEALLRSGAAISEMNLVRRHLSKIKGGGLLTAAEPAQVHTLIISDVPGNDPLSIASGPTIHDATSGAQALAAIDRNNILVPTHVREQLQGTAASDTIVGDHQTRIIASADIALAAAEQTARGLGYGIINLGSHIECEAAELGKMMAAIARSSKLSDTPIGSPAIILSGGETSVTLGEASGGKGGRNTEFLLSLAVELAGETGVWALAADTDGIDGSEDAAGAIITPSTLQRARAAGLDPVKSLSDHDSYSFFQGIEDLLITGPTFTNVNDFRALLIA